MAGGRFLWLREFSRGATRARNFAFVLLMFGLLFGNINTSAQSIAVTGKVVDESGAAIARAQVTLKNAQNKSTQHTAYG